jgi:hypothetical protein
MAVRGVWAIRAGRGSVAAILLAGATAIALGTAVALLGFVWPDLGSDNPPASEPCTSPPCPPESLPSGVELVEASPTLLPVALTALAVLLALAAVTAVLRDDRSRTTLGRSALLVAGPVLVLVGAEVVPHVATPCWSGEIPGVCEATPEHGYDYAGAAHPFGHALLGWVPLALLHTWAVRRWWPEMVPRWVPGAQRRTEAAAER